MRKETVMDEKKIPAPSTSNKPSKSSKSASAKHISEMLDEALVETFPASDAIAIEPEECESPNPAAKSHKPRAKK
jgi:hypothetical protein